MHHACLGAQQVKEASGGWLTTDAFFFVVVI
jgi:hypothetical protein